VLDLLRLDVVKNAAPQDIGTATGFHNTPELDQRLLEVRETKGRAPWWKRVGSAGFR
jgi:hypothetical protein